MNFFTLLYTLIIGPLKILFESIFNIFYNLTGRTNLGISIVLLSLFLNLLLLPLYNKADKIQEEENEIEKKLKSGVDHIKKSFKGDERYMILQSYYRQNNYKQTNVLKGSISLLLEVPFFIAAYDFLSNVEEFRGATFGPILDLSRPDSLITIAGLSINIFPIAMTLINIISCLVYTKGQPLRSKIQLFGMAALFLILLYNSPAALTFYYLLNNIFSLLKNTINKLKNRDKVLTIGSSIIGICIVIFSIIRYGSLSKMFFVCFIIIGIVLQIPLIIKLTNKKIITDKSESNRAIFVFCSIYLSILVGLFIPSFVINSSPQEFVDITTLTNPSIYIIDACLLSIGTFGLWLNVYYFLMNDNVKSLLDKLLVIISLYFTINFFFFEGNLGSISNTLVYDAFPEFSLNSKITNTLILLLFFVATVLFWNLIKKHIKNFSIVVIISLVCISSASIFNINKEYNTTKEVMLDTNNNAISLPLSKKGKNVVIIMLDAAISAYFPYLVYEKPELQKQFQGFTFYSNTLSFGGQTNIGSPTLLGGYEYTPERINARSNEKLVDKQNEALKVMPVLFYSEGYDVTVCDPPLANYNWVPDLSIYDEYEGIKTFNTKKEIFHQDEIDESFLTSPMITLERNLFCYSLFRITPTILKAQIYDNGAYNSLSSDENAYLQKRENKSIASGVNTTFVNYYSTLMNLSNFTHVINDDSNHFFFIDNEATHDAEMLQEPEYIISNSIDNTEYDEEHIIRYSILGGDLRIESSYQASIYQTNMGVMMKIGKWLDFLRENDIYDNTRIIIVSDHGRPIYQFDNLILEDNNDILHMCSLLLVKEFNSNEFKVDNSFMTNADVPTIATKDLIDNPINPFTGELLDQNYKNDEQHVLLTRWDLWDDTQFQGGQWYSVKDDIYDVNNWKPINKQ